ncbi:MAG: permease [Campylobacterota bacterium]|nr:permease [Campylobacterota bacterium]
MKEETLTLKKAFKKALMSFISISPMLIAVMGLVGLMQVYVTPKILSTFFGHGSLTDTLVGTLAGAVSMGQGMISYVVAEGLLEQGVSHYALSAFILAWVTLGFVQLPAEATVFGLKFTFYRNILTLISTISIAYATVLTVGVLS